MSRRILITGVSGFAGRYLAPLMQDNGFEVFGLVQRSLDPTIPGVDVIRQADMRDIQTLSIVINDIQPTHIAHLAAISFVGHGDSREIYDVNVVGTKNLLTSLSKLNNKPECILLCSSANVYGNSKGGALTETELFNPSNDYGISKVAMELTARQFSDQNIVIARPFNYIGRGQLTHFLVPKIVDHFIKREKEIFLGNIDVSRDFSDVRTVVQYFAKLIMSHAPSGEVYNICTGIPTSIKSIISTCEKITGHNIIINKDASLVRKNEIEILCGNPEKIHSHIGQLEEFDLEETLKFMIEFNKNAQILK